MAAKTFLADPIRFNKDEIIFQEGGLIRSYCNSGSNMVQGDYGHYKQDSQLQKSLMGNWQELTIGLNIVLQLIYSGTKGEL